MLGCLLALTGNDEVNSLAALRFAEVLGRSEVYQLNLAEPAPAGDDDKVARTLLGRLLFNEAATFHNLQIAFASGAVIKTTGITDEFSFKEFMDAYGSKAWPLFLATANQDLTVFTLDQQITPEPGQTVVALVFKTV